MTARRDQIRADLGDVVRRAFPDRDFADDVTDATRVFADLGLASIDVVVLAERLEQHYGRRLAFNRFLGELRTRGADDIVVGELVAFLDRELGG